MEAYGTMFANIAWANACRSLCAYFEHGNRYLANNWNGSKTCIGKKSLRSLCLLWHTYVKSCGEIINISTAWLPPTRLPPTTATERADVKQNRRPKGEVNNPWFLPGGVLIVRSGLPRNNTREEVQPRIWLRVNYCQVGNM